MRTDPQQAPQVLMNLKTQEGDNIPQVEQIRQTPNNQMIPTHAASTVTSVLPSSRLRTLEQHQNDYRNEILDKSQRKPLKIGISTNNRRQQSIELSVPGSPKSLRPGSKASKGGEKGQIVEMRVEGDNLIIGVELQSDNEGMDYQQRAFTPIILQNRDDKVQSVQSAYRSELETEK